MKKTTSEVKDYTAAENPPPLRKVLDEKIKNGETNEEEEKRYEQLTPLKAKQIVKGYNLNPQEQKTLLEKHWIRYTEGGS